MAEPKAVRYRESSLPEGTENCQRSVSLHPGVYRRG